MIPKGKRTVRYTLSTCIYVTFALFIACSECNVAAHLSVALMDARMIFAWPYREGRRLMHGANIPPCVHVCLSLIGPGSSNRVRQE